MQMSMFMQIYAAMSICTVNHFVWQNVIFKRFAQKFLDITLFCRYNVCNTAKCLFIIF